MQTQAIIVRTTSWPLDWFKENGQPADVRPGLLSGVSKPIYIEIFTDKPFHNANTNQAHIVFTKYRPIADLPNIYLFSTTVTPMQPLSSTIQVSKEIESLLTWLVLLCSPLNILIVNCCPTFNDHYLSLKE